MYPVDDIDDDDDDDDVCILEDISDPARRSFFVANRKAQIVSPQFSRPISSISVGHVRHKIDASRIVFKAGIQVDSKFVIPCLEKVVISVRSPLSVEQKMNILESLVMYANELKKMSDKNFSNEE